MKAGAEIVENWSSYLDELQAEVFPLLSVVSSFFVLVDLNLFFKRF